jgi:Mn2+/Fe2+ NRAMP family transporter
MTIETGITDPPRTLRASLVHLGPGIILASSIVGSGELIAATTTGAEAGFALLWLIIIGCVIKVGAQVEIGRNTLTQGRTPLEAFDGVPGPRFRGRGWIYWGWVVMTALVVVQQGGILVGVAQTLATGLPVTSAGRAWTAAQDEAAALRVAAAAARHGGDASQATDLTARLDTVQSTIATLEAPNDVAIWCVVTAAVTAVLLAVGRYWLIEQASLALVGTFTCVTLLALVLLQFEPAWAISGAELASGLWPSIPPAVNGRAPLETALATFGIIGVGAAELMFYPYWCLEKGYGRAVGPRDASPAWAERARGWLGVMRLDAWSSMVVYTVVTICFYMLGAATLGRLGLRPQGSDMVRTLGAMYAPVFGHWAQSVFLVGAFAVLYSTLFIAAAGNARLLTDACILNGVLPGDDATRARANRWLSVAWIFVALVLALVIREPVAMVLASGLAQAIMLAALGIAVLYFRHIDLDPRLRPSFAWDLLLWASAGGFIIVGLWTAWQKSADILGIVGRLWAQWQAALGIIVPV